jgi:hypothetical protein
VIKVIGASDGSSLVPSMKHSDRGNERENRRIETVHAQSLPSFPKMSNQPVLGMWVILNNYCILNKPLRQERIFG